MSQLKPGTIIDERFELLNEVGQGGMGVVYRARQMSMGRDVAVKLLKTSLSASPDQVTRFQREARIISGLEHRNIVQIYAVGIAEHGQPYIAMELLGGRQLSEIIKEEGPLPWRLAVEYMLEVCDALQFAHDHQIIHRDVKPSNIVVNGHGTAGDATVKLVDFGIAKSLIDSGPALTRTEMVMGSVFYLSPGQFQGRMADSTSDIYSLGCSLFELLTGVPPFVGDTIYDTVAKQANDPLPKVNNALPAAKIPEDLQRLLEAMTAKNPEHRVKTPHEVKAYLQQILRDDTIQLVAAPTPAKPARRTKFPVAVAILIGLLISAAVAGYLLTRPKPTIATEFTANPLLTGDKIEIECVQIIHRLVNTDLQSSWIVKNYIDLSHVYDSYRMYSASRLCLLQARKYRSVMADDQPLVIDWLLAENLCNLGRFQESARFAERMLKTMSANDDFSNEMVLTAIKANSKLHNYARAAELSRSFRKKYSDRLNRPSLVVKAALTTLPALIETKDYSLAQTTIQELKKNLESQDPLDLGQVTARVYEMEIDLTRKPTDEAAFGQLLADMTKKGYGGIFTARLRAQHGDEHEALRVSDVNTKRILEMTVGSDLVMQAAWDAQSEFLSMENYVSSTGQAHLESNRRRLIAEFEKCRAIVNDASKLKMPVPVDAVAAQEKAVLDVSP